MKKEYYYVAGAIIVVAVLAGVFMMKDSEDVVVDSENTTSTSQNSTSTSSEPASTATKVVHSKPVAADPRAGFTYTQAVQVFEGRRIQFDAACQAVPYNTTYTNGVTLMLDNRAAKSTTLAINGETHQIPGYDFKIITLRYSDLPQKVLIDCGTSRNVATILIQG